MAECLFCKIVSGEVDSDKVAENEHALAFRDMNPGAPTHVLVIPKGHITSAAELDHAHAQVLGGIFTLLAEIARNEGLAQGFRIVTNAGPDAGQSVHHLHFHLLGGRAMGWPPG